MAALEASPRTDAAQASGQCPEGFAFVMDRPMVA
jgi:hypothetical protein